MLQIKYIKEYESAFCWSFIYFNCIYSLKSYLTQKTNDAQLVDNYPRRTKSKHTPPFPQQPSTGPYNATIGIQPISLLYILMLFPLLRLGLPSSLFP
jgi:hypothetical protein